MLSWFVQQQRMQQFAAWLRHIFSQPWNFGYPVLRQVSRSAMDVSQFKYLGERILMSPWAFCEASLFRCWPRSNGSDIRGVRRQIDQTSEIGQAWAGLEHFQTSPGRGLLQQPHWPVSMLQMVLVGGASRIHWWPYGCAAVTVADQFHWSGNDRSTKNLARKHQFSHTIPTWHASFSKLNSNVRSFFGQLKLRILIAMPSLASAQSDICGLAHRNDFIT
jgi:hypothetical protein